MKEIAELESDIESLEQDVLFVEKQRDKARRRNKEANVVIRQLEAENKRLREALQTIADECEIEFQYAADVANAALKEHRHDK